MNIKSKLTYSNFASTTALLLAVSGVGGAAYAAGVAKNSVGSPQIKDGQVKTVDLGKSSVTGAKVKNGSLAKNDLNKAAKKAFTTDAVFDRLDFHNLKSNDPDKTIFELNLPAGAYLITASGHIVNEDAVDNDFLCSISQPVGDFTNEIAKTEVRVPILGHHGQVALSGVAINTQGTIVVTMTCEAEYTPYDAKLLDPRITAVKLASADED